MSHTVLVLGGYGTTGTTLSELLLEYAGAEVILAGRNGEKGRAAAAALDSRFPGRVTARVADAADAASLSRAFAGVDLVAVAASVLEHVDTVARAALDAGADYFDLLLSGEEKFAALEALRPRAEADGRCFITDGGIHPGVSAAMIRALAPAFGRLERAEVGGLLRVDWNAYDFQPSTIHEFANEFRDYRVEAWRGGAWTKVEWRDAMRTFDFGAPFGSERCSLMYMKELELLPERLPALRDCAFYVSGFNPVVDTTVLPLGMVVMRAVAARARPAVLEPARLVAAPVRKAAIRHRVPGGGGGRDGRRRRERRPAPHAPRRLLADGRGCGRLPAAVGRRLAARAGRAPAGPGGRPRPLPARPAAHGRRALRP